MGPWSARGAGEGGWNLAAPHEPSAAAVRDLLAEGRTFPAYDQVLRLRAAAPEDRDLAALEARVLDRLGRAAEAQALLEGLGVEGGEDPEALGLLAALVKRAALAAPGAARREGLERARALYARGWRRMGGTWFGINVATLDRVLGRRDDARQAARAVLEVVRLEEERAGDDGEAGLWRRATAAEAHLVAGDAPRALEAYRALREAVLPRRAWDALASARRNARLLLDAPDPDAADPDAALSAVADDVLAALSVPPVVLATGHLADPPDRDPPRFPATLIPAVRRALGSVLDAWGASAGFSSLAAGADILFQDELARRGVARHVLLPFDEATFLETSVAGRGPYGWTDDFQRLWRGASRVYQASRHHPGEDAAAYAYANEMLLGLARLEADRREADLVAVAVWDGKPGEGPGGTACALEAWRASGLLADVRVVPLDDEGRLARGEARPLPPVAAPAGKPSAVPPYPAAEGTTAIAAMLFADARGFGRLDEAETAAFVEHYFGVVARVQARYAEQVVEANTWGDGLFYVFGDVEAAGRFALDLAEALGEAKARLETWGLPPDLGLRMALHAGPVRFVRNPITGRVGAFGAQVSVAARMEPVAPVDQAFASEAFAALCRARGARTISCRYVGRRELAKRYGGASIYRLER